jgi:predicted metalloprotease
MRWQGEQGSDNVEDRRGDGAPMGMPVGGMRFPGGGGGMGIAGVLVLLVIGWLTGINPLDLVNGGSSGNSGNGGYSAPAPVRSSGDEEQRKQFVSVVLRKTETIWSDIFRTRLHGTYEDPKLVLFRGSVSSACGFADAAMGPFYCPGDRKVYLDMAFFDDMQRKLGAPGDFAEAYVIAHEVGHHVQNLLGISDQVHSLRTRSNEVESNKASVHLELQADYFAGVWAHYVKDQGLLDIGDVDEALNAAAAVGDDRLQQRARGYVVPESFTHGSSAQRSKWFRLGFDTGDPMAHDPFKEEK